MSLSQLFASCAYASTCILLVRRVVGVAQSGCSVTHNGPVSYKDTVYALYSLALRLSLKVNNHVCH